MSNILVVDDSMTERKLAVGILRRDFDGTIAEADCAEAGLEYLESHAPDLVLTDLQMPGLDGLQLVERIRDEWPGLPVVLMTSQGSEEIAARALKVGAASYVPKMRLTSDLVVTIQRIVRAASQERTHSRLMHSLDSGELNFTIRNDLALISPLVKLIQEMLRSLPLGDEAERLRVGVAVEEAIKNAVYHGNLEIGSTLEEGRSLDDLVAERLYQAPYSNRRVIVSLWISHEQAAFAVRDEGPGFDFAPFESDDFDSNAPRGRGIQLMRTFMDSVEFRDDGREVLLRKKRYDDDTPEEEEEA